MAVAPDALRSNRAARGVTVGRSVCEPLSCTLLPRRRLLRADCGAAEVEAVFPPDRPVMTSKLQICHAVTQGLKLEGKESAVDLSSCCSESAQDKGAWPHSARYLLCPQRAKGSVTKKRS